MDFKAVKGTRDFYPDEMALRNWLIDAWRRVSLRNGFVEFDAPVMEYLDLFRVKSGDEIVSQLFSLTDRGGRELALRPEMTPSLARMVNARINALPRPIKWFCIPRCFRAENPQKGRFREFFQWNVDVIGSDSVVADAECIATCVDLLREVGLSPDDVVVRIGSRPLTMAALRKAGVAEDDMPRALAAVDKRPKLSAEDFAKFAAESGIPAGSVEAICEFQDAPDASAAAAALDGEDVAEDLAQLEALMGYLGDMGAADYCRMDLRMVRGLAYYTGIVYEVFDADQSLRAVAGGGRYDNLLEVLGGPAVGATGFGMGDVVLGILLGEKGKLPDVTARVDCFVISPGGDVSAVLKAVGALRRAGVRADFSMRTAGVGKLLKEANRRNARYAAILEEDGRVGLKDLASGEQTDMAMDELLADAERLTGWTEPGIGPEGAGESSRGRQPPVTR